jgi:hypothetical protein
MNSYRSNKKEVYLKKRKTFISNYKFNKLNWNQTSIYNLEGCCPNR